jgi:hypothetical protein
MSYVPTLIMLLVLRDRWRSPVETANTALSIMCLPPWAPVYRPSLPTYHHVYYVVKQCVCPPPPKLILVGTAPSCFVLVLFSCRKAAPT